MLISIRIVHAGDDFKPLNWQENLGQEDCRGERSRGEGGNGANAKEATTAEIFLPFIFLPMDRFQMSGSEEKEAARAPLVAALSRGAKNAG